MAKTRYSSIIPQKMPTSAADSSKETHSSTQVPEQEMKNGTILLMDVNK